MCNQNKITNRHIAKLLTRLDFLNLPDIAQDDIKRQMHFLKEDIISEQKGASGNELDKGKSRT